jgi:hypothetical protein
VKDAWEYLSRLPELLNQWGSYSYALLAALLLIGLASLVVYARFVPKKNRPVVLFYLGLFVSLLAVGGFLLKTSGAIAQRGAQNDWITAHQSRAGERRLVVSNLYRVGMGEPTREEAAAREFVSMVATILGEDLPPSIPAPLVVPINFSEQLSPWKAGVGQENFRDVLEQLRVCQIMWGDLDTSRGVARTFLGIPREISASVDAIIPLRDLPLGSDPRGELQFGEGYHRLLGHVALGIALQTMHEAEAASGDHRKQLFVLASQQLRETQARLVNAKNDPVLKRNLYDRGDRLIENALAQAEISP